jgi:hypothetical protein
LCVHSAAHSSKVLVRLPTSANLSGDFIPCRTKKPSMHPRRGTFRTHRGTCTSAREPGCHRTSHWSHRSRSGLLNIGHVSSPSGPIPCVC